MPDIKPKIDGVLPWIGGLETEKELILLSAVGGNPETDKISGGRINLLFVTEPDLFIEQLVNGVRHWAKNVSYAYFNYNPVDAYMPLSEQIPKPSIKEQDIIHLVVNRGLKTREYASRATSYFKYLNSKQPEGFTESILRLKSIQPELLSKEKELIVYYYKYLRKLHSQQITAAFPINSKTVITMKNMAEAYAKLQERSIVFEEDVEMAAQLFINTLRMLGIEEEKQEVDYFNEEQRIEWQRKKINELYLSMKGATIEGYMSREKIRRLGKRIGLTSNEADECMKVMQETGYITPEKNDKVKVV